MPRSSANRPSLRAHVFRALLFVSFAIVAVVVAVAAPVLQRGLLAAGERDLMRECSIVAAYLDASEDQSEAVSQLKLDEVRVTLIAQDGVVLYDSSGLAAHMENHAMRPEVIGAFETGYGSAVRESSTLFAVSLYGAHILENGNVVRLAILKDGVMRVLVDLIPLALVVVLVLLVFCAVTSRYLSNRLVRPFSQTDLTLPVESVERGGVYVEVEPLLAKIDDQKRQIEQQLERLTDNDRMRVEFTANVTHELKTPLTVVSGYAELIKTGIANPNDVAGFAGRIYDEAQHLTALVNDILTLSRMDEAERIDEKYGTMEPVDLRELCEVVLQRLGAKARDLNIAVETSFEHGVVVEGVPKLLDQIVYNLCDNALRYNRPGGSVAVSCGFNPENRPYLCVRDTGIGIAEENLEKVFNRFFRVDAGRSRETGGTGLGLAIVKHAARCHDAELGIESTLGEGTAITVVFNACRLP